MRMRWDDAAELMRAGYRTRDARHSVTATEPGCVPPPFGRHARLGPINLLARHAQPCPDGFPGLRHVRYSRVRCPQERPSTPAPDHAENAFMGSHRADRRGPDRRPSMTPSATPVGAG